MQTSSTRFSFWSLLGSYSVRIPLIQRDYAQGRATAGTVRRRFVASLHAALTAPMSGACLDLDFVYGELVTPDVFVPLDGQQRLTTLYLLHWYLAAVENRIRDEQGQLTEIGTRLLKFTYDTRSSSREFCRGLVRHGGITSAAGTLGQQLREAAWFQPAWERDPTVAAMLTMLAALAAALGPASGLLERLLAPNEPRIVFHFLPLSQLGRPDDLYLKMNARGKELTEFEHWKAFFEQLLRKHYPEPQVELAGCLWAEAYASQFDGAWTDLFWRLDPATRPTPELLGTHLLQFLEQFTRLLDHWAGDPGGRSNFYEMCQRVYGQSEAHVRFLYQALTLLSALPERNSEAFFATLFTRTASAGKVTLFDDAELNLLAACSNERVDIRTRALLFALLRYGVAYGHLAATDANLLDTLRITRNVLLRVRPGSEAAAVALLKLLPQSTSPIYQQLQAQAQELTEATWPDELRHELTKAVFLAQHLTLKTTLHDLEDQAVLQGQLDNLALASNAGRLPDFARAVREIWTPTLRQDHLVQAWLSVGEYWRWYNWSRLGDVWDFGTAKGGTRGWRRLLTSTAQAAVGEQLPALLTSYLAAPGTTAAERLAALTQRWLTTATPSDWRYYFIKYPQMLADSDGFCTRSTDRQYEVRLLTSDNVKARHINPYVRTVARLLADETRCPEWEAYVHNAQISPLYLYSVPDGRPAGQTAELYCTEPGWCLVLPATSLPAPELHQHYHLRPAAKPGNWLVESLASDVDRIELAVAFVQDLYLLGLSSASPVAI